MQRTSLCYMIHWMKYNCKQGHFDSTTSVHLLGRASPPHCLCRDLGSPYNGLEKHRGNDSCSERPDVRCSPPTVGDTSCCQPTSSLPLLASRVTQLTIADVLQPPSHLQERNAPWGHQFTDNPTPRTHQQATGAYHHMPLPNQPSSAYSKEG